MHLEASLLLHCPDVKGIVYEVSRFLFERGGNIIDAQQHREEMDNRFFMRVHFDASDMDAPQKSLRGELDTLSAQFDMKCRLQFSDERPKIAVMVSRYDHCLYDLLLRHRYGELHGDVGVIISNHPDLAAVAQHFEVDFHHFPMSGSLKAEAERRILDALKSYEIDLVVLARYMQILTPTLVDPYKNRIINVHHGFLPAFKGARPYHQAYEKGVKLIGATSHYVTADLDMGPIIEQASVPVKHSHSVEDLITMGRDIETQVLANAVKAHLDSRIMVSRDRTIVFD
ncbi:MAG: formyltetrahydrofolate deformylase [Candidatus Hydrogenedentes bacterium]|nr:formyltetrahydrofolate deformylase [Candidatus Hydrogenedentota bacterium]